MEVFEHPLFWSAGGDGKVEPTQKWAVPLTTNLADTTAYGRRPDFAGQIHGHTFQMLSVKGREYYKMSGRFVFREAFILAIFKTEHLAEEKSGGHTFTYTQSIHLCVTFYNLNA